ncbi:MAG: IclR family transcriptional regulator [Pseudomonadota bacterium]
MRLQPLIPKDKKAPNLSRGLDILELVLKKKGGVSFTQILNTLQIPRASLARILKTLIERQYLSKDEQTGYYGLGLKLIQLGGSVSGSIKINKYASEAMEWLWEKSQETVELVILDRDQLVLVDQIVSRKGIRVYNRIGSAFPFFHATACGKIYLAFMDPVKRNNAYEKIGLPSITHFTLSNRKKLDQELKRVKERGYATENQEVREGIYRIAAPAFDADGGIACCLSIAGLYQENHAKREKELAGMVIEASKKISRNLGVKF